MECYHCIHAHISKDPTGGDFIVSVVCEHYSFHIPMLLIQGFESWLETRPDNWRPERCPKGDDE